MIRADALRKLWKASLYRYARHRNELFQASEQVMQGIGTNSSWLWSYKRWSAGRFLRLTPFIFAPQYKGGHQYEGEMQNAEQLQM